MWWYWLLAAIGAAAIILYMYYRRVANRIKCQPLKDIPCPPLTHPLLGHPEKMSHPMRHELRLQICNAAAGGIHQLMMMRYVSIFINDCKEAARCLLSFREKGMIYASFRYDQKIPDLMTSDNEEWTKRHTAFAPCLSAAYSNATVSLKDLMDFLEKKSETSEVVDMSRLFTLLAFDIVCDSVFHYKLGAVAGSSEGARLADCLATLRTWQDGQGYFPKPGVRKVPDAELKETKENWKAFIEKLMGVQRTAAEQYRAKHNSLDTARVFGHALLALSESDSTFSSSEVFAEVHQVLRHAQECIAGQLCWLFVALHRNLKVRRKLEEALDADSSATGVPNYLEAFLKETLRRYPVAGNATVRSVTQPNSTLMNGKYSIPVGTFLHVHAWSLHNTDSIWDKPKQLLPERWLSEEQAAADAEEEEEDALPKAPKYPAVPQQGQNASEFSVYDGAGHEEGGLSYFPFSAGERVCPGRRLAVKVLLTVVKTIAKTYRLDPLESTWEEDLGITASAVVVPALDKSTTVRVRRRGADVKEVKETEGWADESDEEN